ncbi:MAG TPA: hypothetical protein VFH95_05565 [Candidatus Kapabacteria bacterium]|nr:hypothetical protein [Candidatus Kapabacteria bacterium]
MPTMPFDEILMDHLQDPESIAIFLNDAIQSGNAEEIIQAIQIVMEAHDDSMNWNELSLYVPKILTQLHKYGLSLEFRPSSVAAQTH